MDTTIAIVGGGPAGCAAALTLRRFLPDLSTTLITTQPSSGADAPAVGETLSPGALPLLDYLGVREEFQRMGHLPCGGTASAWGSPQVSERNYLFTGRGNGWHLDRAAFDGWLLSRAEDSGMRCIRSRALSATRLEGKWRIDFEGEGALVADAIVDATGRSAWLLRNQGEAPRRDDGLVADARWFTHDRTEASSDGALVESTADGWWYSATLPDRRGVAMFMTDNDLLTQNSREARLASAPATSARIASWKPTGEAAVRAANSRCSEVVVGQGWVAAGDTAAAFDPISSLGIGFSMRSGMEAARVAVGFAEDDNGPAVAYADSVRRIYADYQARLRGIYELEQRWPDNPFWARRRK